MSALENWHVLAGGCTESEQAWLHAAGCGLGCPTFAASMCPDGSDISELGSSNSPAPLSCAALMAALGSIIEVIDDLRGRAPACGTAANILLADCHAGCGEDLIAELGRLAKVIDALRGWAACASNFRRRDPSHGEAGTPGRKSSGIWGNTRSRILSKS